jgi:hypothetical protein
MINPASAGPMERATLTPTMSSLVAARSCVLGTSSGIIACHVGSCTAAPIARANVKASSRAGGIRPAAVSAVNKIPMTKT